MNTTLERIIELPPIAEEVMCVNHMLGYSKAVGGMPTEHPCSGCTKDLYNEQCPRYKPVKVYYYEVV